MTAAQRRAARIGLLGAIGLLIMLAPLLLLLALPAAAQDTPPTQTPRVYPTHTPHCTGTVPTRLVVHQRGRVSSVDPRPMNVRESPGAVTEVPILGEIPAGDTFYVLAGPACTELYTWYEVRYRSGGTILIGWIAEGEPGIYYVEPYPPGR